MSVVPSHRRWDELVAALWAVESIMPKGRSYATRSAAPMKISLTIPPVNHSPTHGPQGLPLLRGVHLAPPRQRHQARARSWIERGGSPPLQVRLLLQDLPSLPRRGEQTGLESKDSGVDGLDVRSRALLLLGGLPPARSPRSGGGQEQGALATRRCEATRARKGRSTPWHLPNGSTTVSMSTTWPMRWHHKQP